MASAPRFTRRGMAGTGYREVMTNNEIPTNPDLLDGGLTDAHLTQSHDARSVTDFNRDLATDAGDTQQVTPEDIARERRCDDEITRISERGAAERRHLVGLSTKEPGGAISMTANGAEGTFKEGYQWSDGRYVPRKTIEHPDWVKSMLRQNADVTRARKFAAADRTLFGVPKTQYDENDTPLSPDEAAPDFQPVVKAGGFEVVRPARRSSKAQRAKFERLAHLRREIREAIKHDDHAGAGRALRTAKRVVGHGGFSEWVKHEIGITSRTAQRYMRA